MTRRQLPNVVSVTRSLGITKRTLRRHLSALGLSFRATADDLLGRYARRLLREGQLPVAVVAERLGYAESASFIRAFARWTGETPHAHRSRSR